MASPQGYDKKFTHEKCQIFDVDADYSTAAVVTATALDMSLYADFRVLAMASALTGSGITKLEIVAGSDSGVTTDVTVIKDSGTVAADAVGDYVALECSALEVAQEGADAAADLRYVAVRLTNDNAGDEAVICTMATARYPEDGLTATTIS